MIQRLWTVLGPITAASSREQRLLSAIREEAKSLVCASDEDLARSTDRLRPLYRRHEARSATALVAAFAAVVEAVRRTYGLELYDVQVSAGLAIARGKIAEMQTGEGKTLAAAMPAFLQSLGGQGVHVVTPNPYLAQRDFELLAPVYRALGATAGLLPESADLVGKRAAYDCDITYGTGYEFGFDYLREQLALLKMRRAPLGDRYRSLLRGDAEPPSLGARRGFAIIDEVDSVLIDEACTPLVLGDPIADMTVTVATLEHALHLAATLAPGRDYVFDDHSRGVLLTEPGRQRCYQAISSETGNTGGPWSESVQQALVALHVLSRDVDYVVSGGRVVFVDAATGRLCPDRTWRNGLQQLLEVKEGLHVTPMQPTAARITRQRYFGKYGQLAGMTGTAVESAGEFRQTYGLRVATIAPRLPSRRTALPDRVFVDDQSRWRAAAGDIARVHATGRPLLVGCRTIDKSQQLAARLSQLGIRFQLLNGKQTAAEAEVIAQAGDRGSVTIATNMAGRGTDIKLEPVVAELGGLHLIAIERNDSLRVDRQLIGRVARGGDPGSYQFYLSAEDSLLQREGADLAGQIKARPEIAGEVTTADLSPRWRAVQSRVEAAACRLRKKLAAADTWLCEELGGLMH